MSRVGRPEPPRAKAKANATVTFVVAVAVVACASLSFTIDSPPSAASLTVLTAIAVLAAFSSYTPIRVHLGKSVQELTVDEALLIVALVASPAWAPVAMGVGTVIAQLSQRGRARLKVAYNTASVVLVATAASQVYLLLEGFRPVGTAAWAGAALAASLTSGVLSLLLISVLLHIHQGPEVWSTLPRSLPANSGVWVANAAVGILLALVVDRHVIWLLLGSLVLVGLHVGYRGYAAARRDRERVQQLRSVSQALAAVATNPSAFQRALEAIAERLQASGAILTAEIEGARMTTAVGAAAGSATLTALDRTATAGRGRTVGDGRFDIALVAPLIYDRQCLGAVAVHGRLGLESWSDTDTQLLEAVGAELAVAVTNLSLLRQVERERARLEKESSKLADVLSAATDGIGVVRGDGQVDTWNPGMTAATGVTPSDAVGRPWWTVLRLKDAEDRELLPGGDHIVARALAGERTDEPVGLQVLRRDGQWRWARVSFAPLVHEGGTSDGTVMVVRDVTAEREVAALKADFVATVSHELRTPLTPLKGFVTTLRHHGDHLDEAQRELLLESMQGQVGRLERLVSDLLLVADIDNGVLNLHPGAVDLRDGIVAAVLAEEPDDQTRIHISEDGHGQAMGDRQAVVRIARSLISNAIKHTAGEVWVDCGTAGDSVWLTVRDEGPGIPPWEQERVFERFTRLGDHLLRTQGPGLGLPIARALSEELGGTLSIVSDVGEGATFRLMLPAARPRTIRQLEPEVG